MAPKKPSLTPKKSSTPRKSTSKKSTSTSFLEGNLIPRLQSLIVEPLLEKPNPIVYIDVKIGGEEKGRLLIELFKHITPKTVENFRCLCTGERSMGKQGKKMHYKKSIFFRVIPGAYAQGGDIIKNNGTSGESIYDGKAFEDENFVKSNAQVGSWAMCNTGPNSNESQFFINLAPNPDLDGKHVVFGQVKEKSMNILKIIESIGSWSGRTHQTISIGRCGWKNKPTKEEFLKMAEEAIAKKVEEEDLQALQVEVG
jgi:peptidylprolyl isomerase